MTSKILSRLLPSGNGESIYETLRQNEDSSDQSDIEEQAGMALDEENLKEGFNDYELDEVLANADLSSTPSSKILASNRTSEQRTGRAHQSFAQTRLSQRRAAAEELDDDVPQSLLFEGDGPQVMAPREQQRQPAIPVPMSGLALPETRAKWQAVQERQRLHPESDILQSPQTGHPPRRVHIGGAAHPREKAMWRWANVENLDNFLKDVYDYFLGNGIWCILLGRVLNLLTLAFVVGFTTFLTSCIEYKKIPSSKTMSQILVPQCTKQISGLTNLLIWLFAFLWICKGFQYALDVPRLHNMHNFYHYLLEIPDTEIQTVSWQEVVRKLMLLRDSNPATAAGVSKHHRRFIGTQSKQRMDAHDIANRLMRRDNYLIALVNKDILDLTLPVPFFKNRQLFSKTLEWNLSLCILDFVFNEQGQVRQFFLKDAHRRALSDGLRRRFLFAGIMNVFCAPFIFVYFIMLYFFRYFNEYQKNPSQIGSRQYTPFAEWKFREFNELWHLFQRRINMSYPFASRYLDQFPKDKTVQLSRFVAFVSGALVSVLALASVIDPEMFLGFEITRERTVLFYVGLFGTIWAVARGGVPEENLVFDPEFALSNVIEYTHYLPGHWQGRLHSDEVRSEFALLYQMKVVIFLEEMLSIIFTPFILWFSLPKCSDKIVDFFREFTVHVDGLGYVCSFAVFDFQKGANVPGKHKDGIAQDLRGEYYSTKDGKMLASYYGFIDNYVNSQRAGAPYLHQGNKQNFHPPPAFPGLTVPSPAAETTVSSSKTVPRDSQQRPSSHVRYAGQGNTNKSIRFGAAAGLSSPLASALLDPQHQPSQREPRGGLRHSVHYRLKPSHRSFVEPKEDAEDVLQDNASRSEHAGCDDVAADESNLGESWKSTRAGNIDDDGMHETNASNSDKEPGVLGLVYQFTTEGRGTGVNI